MTNENSWANEIPSGLTPYGTLIFCSNMLHGMPAPILVSGNYPIIIGKGISPQVWIAAPTDDTRSLWSFVVEKNKARDHRFRVEATLSSISVFAGTKKILEIVALSGDVAEVNFVDLNPIGLKINGNSTNLKVGGGGMSNMNVEGMSALISID